MALEAAERRCHVPWTAAPWTGIAPPLVPDGDAFFLEGCLDAADRVLA